MCEVLAVAWNEPLRFERVLPWATDLEPLGVSETAGSTTGERG